MGTAWSHNALSLGTSTVIRLQGDFAQIRIDPASGILTVGAGAMLCDVYKVAESMSRQILSMDYCMTYEKSRTVGGLLVVDASHSGMPSFRSVALRVQLAVNGRLVWVEPDDPQIRHGCVITRAEFRTEPLTFYRPDRLELHCANTLEMTVKLKTLYEGDPLDGGNVYFMTRPTNSFRVHVHGYRRVGENVRQLSPPAGFDACKAPGPVESSVTRLLWRWMPCATHRLLLSACAIVTSLDHDTRTWHALGDSRCLVLPHEEVEFHVPLDMAETAAGVIDTFLGTRSDYMLSLRYARGVHGVYMSYSFRQYVLNRIPAFKESMMELSRGMPTGTWVHRGKGQYVAPTLLADPCAPRRTARISGRRASS